MKVLRAVRETYRKGDLPFLLVDLFFMVLEKTWWKLILAGVVIVTVMDHLVFGVPIGEILYGLGLTVIMIAVLGFIGYLGLGAIAGPDPKLPKTPDHIMWPAWHEFKASVCRKRIES